MSKPPEPAILDINLNDIPYHFRTIIPHILLSASIMIARNWKNQITPTLTELIRKVNFSCHSELTLTPFNPTPSKRLELWALWTKSKYYIENVPWNVYLYKDHTPLFYFSLNIRFIVSRY